MPFDETTESTESTENAEGIVLNPVISVVEITIYLGERSLAISRAARHFPRDMKTAASPNWIYGWQTNWTKVSVCTMSTVLEIESAVKELTIHEAQKLAEWLQNYVGKQTATGGVQSASAECKLPDYAARRRRIVGEKVLPNMVTLGREQERW